MKTYTKKIGADRAIASITAANTELFELDVIKLETIKSPDGASFYIRATVIDPAVIDLDRLRAEPRISDIVIEEPEIEIDPALAAGGKFADIMKPADQAIPAQRRGSASERAAAKRAARADAIKSDPQTAQVVTEAQAAANAELSAAADIIAPKPTILDMATSLETLRAISPKPTKDEARHAAVIMFGADAVEGVDFEIVKGGRGLYSALRPDVAATIKRTTRMILTADEAAAARNRKRVEAAERPKRERGNGVRPVGMQALVVELCMREQGATPAQLKELTKWQGTPWKWFLGNNPKKTGLADRFGYEFEARKGAGKEVTYFLRQPATMDAQASQTDNPQQVAAA